MLPDAINRELKLPAGYLKSTRKLATLNDVKDDLSVLVPVADLKPSELQDIILARIKAGAWQDTIDSTDGFIDQHRAIREIKQGTQAGKTIIEIYSRALVWLLEDWQNLDGGKKP